MQQDTVTGERMMEILLNGVSTRRYSRVIPEMADTGGCVAIDAEPGKHRSFRSCAEQLLERRFDDVELLIIYIDGMHFGDQCAGRRGCGYSGPQTRAGAA